MQYFHSRHLETSNFLTIPFILNGRLRISNEWSLEGATYINLWWNFRGLPKPFSSLHNISKHWWFETKQFTRLWEFIKLYKEIPLEIFFWGVYFHYLPKLYIGWKKHLIMTSFNQSIPRDGLPLSLSGTFWFTMPGCLHAIRVTFLIAFLTSSPFIFFFYKHKFWHIFPFYIYFTLVHSYMYLSTNGLLLHIISWEPQGCYQYSKMFRWEPEGRYRCTKSMAIAPFWFSTEHLSKVIAPLWLSTDNMSMVYQCKKVYTFVKKVYTFVKK